jgi:hypothetical protein
MNSLADALDRSREMIETALADARAELAALHARRSELEALIAQGETALGGARPPATPQTAMTLHQALEQVLREGGNAPMTARPDRRGQRPRPLPQARRQPGGGQSGPCAHQ